MLEVNIIPRVTYYMYLKVLKKALSKQTLDELICQHRQL